MSSWYTFRLVLHKGPMHSSECTLTRTSCSFECERVAHAWVHLKWWFKHSSLNEEGGGYKKAFPYASVIFGPYPPSLGPSHRLSCGGKCEARMYGESVIVRDIHIDSIVLVFHMNLTMLQVFPPFFLLLLGRFKPTTCVPPSPIPYPIV